MENNPNLTSPPPEEKKSAFRQKWDDIKINFVFWLTGWLTIILFMQFGDQLPEPDWPYYLDEILIVIFSWCVIFIVLDAVPGIFYVLAVGAALYFTFDYFRPMYNAGREIHSASSSTQENTQDLQKAIDSLEQRVIFLHRKMDSLQIWLYETKPPHQSGIQ